MKYDKVIKGRFISRPNRFIAYVDIDGNVEKVHVKNTGRCKELLVDGCNVYLSVSDNPSRKTKYDLIATEKKNENGEYDHVALYKSKKEVEPFAVLQEGVSIRGGKPYFRNDAAKQLWNTLEEQDAIRIVSGKLPVTKIVPVTNLCGYLTQTEAEAELKVNANFFIMDSFDCATVYDHVGTPFGLCVKDGTVIHPPLYNREVLLVDKNGGVSIRNLDITE